MTARPRYPTQDRVCKLVESARAAGVRIGAIEFGRDGSLRIFDAGVASEIVKADGGSAYDRHKARRDAS